MAGHSHAANVAARKNSVDAKRGKLFSKLCRAIYVAAKNGNPDPASNIRLRYAIDKAKSYSCPKDNIERSIKKASGELGADNFDEVMYEGYGPNGVAVMCEVLTDNRNRTAGDLRKAFEVCGGNLGSTGCVGYLFTYKGMFVISADKVSEDQLMEVVLEAGADDLKHDGDYWVVTCDPKSFDDVKLALESHNIEPDTAETSYIPSTTVELDAEAAKKMIKLRETLDDNEDVQNVYSNDLIPDGVEA
jgi:YebC/PmpR family DNA-binding regulatory protein